jgi:hypothetical protein
MDVRWNDHELLESETTTGVRATVEHVHEWHWEDVWLLGAGEIADVGVKRDTLLSSGSLGHSHGHTEDGVGAELGLVGGAIELVEESINSGLVLDVDVLLDESWSDLLVHVVDGLGDTLECVRRLRCCMSALSHVLTLAAPLALVTIAELASLVGTGGCAGWDDGAVEASLGDNVDLNGWVTARVVDGTGVDLGDRHDSGEAIGVSGGV